MKYGVVYKFKPFNKINGTLFYCFEYFSFLKKFRDVKFYIVGIQPNDLEAIKTIFRSKYNASLEDIVSISVTQLYQLKLDRTLILDVHTFYNTKEFLTNEVHCFSNEPHEMFRYNNDRQVTYYGSYPYQNFDVKCILKLNFEIFKPLTQSGAGVFVSALCQKYIRNNLERWKAQFKKEVILKKSHGGVGNLFELIDSVHYVHTERDTNNRIIPEAFFYNKKVTVEDVCGIEDSIKYRFEDISENGLAAYTLTEKDEMIQACLR